MKTFGRKSFNFRPSGHKDQYYHNDYDNLVLPNIHPIDGPSSSSIVAKWSQWSIGSQWLNYNLVFSNFHFIIIIIINCDQVVTWGRSADLRSTDPLWAENAPCKQFADNQSQKRQRNLVQSEKIVLLGDVQIWDKQIAHSFVICLLQVLTEIKSLHICDSHKICPIKDGSWFLTILRLKIWVQSQWLLSFFWTL